MQRIKFLLCFETRTLHAEFAFAEQLTRGVRLRQRVRIRRQRLLHALFALEHDIG